MHDIFNKPSKSICCCIIDFQECCRKYQKEISRKCSIDYCKNNKFGADCCNNCGDGYPDLLCLVDGKLFAVELKDTEKVTEYSNDIKNKYNNIIYFYSNIKKFIIIVRGLSENKEYIREKFREIWDKIEFKIIAKPKMESVGLCS